MTAGLAAGGAGFVVAAVEAAVRGEVPAIGFANLAPLIVMAVQLGLTTVAGGVETEGDVHAVQRAGCSLGQSYYFSRPVAVDALWERVDRNPRVPHPRTAAEVQRACARAGLPLLLATSALPAVLAAAGGEGALPLVRGQVAENADLGRCGSGRARPPGMAVTTVTSCAGWCVRTRQASMWWCASEERDQLHGQHSDLLSTQQSGL